jgi:hypothetical protein
MTSGDWLCRFAVVVLPCSHAPKRLDRRDSPVGQSRRIAPLSVNVAASPGPRRNGPEHGVSVVTPCCSTGQTRFPDLMSMLTPLAEHRLRGDADTLRTRNTAVKIWPATAVLGTSTASSESARCKSIGGTWTHAEPNRRSTSAEPTFMHPPNGSAAQPRQPQARS